MKTLAAFIIGLLATPLLFAALALSGRLPSDAVSEPPKWESSLGMRALDASLERRSQSLKGELSPNDPAVIAAGQKIYADDCAGCHGSAKGPSVWGSKGLYPRAPQFFQEGSDVSPREAYAAIHDGIRYSGMGAWRDLMKEEDMWKVAYAVASISGRKPMKDRD
ncbi:MAG TPA: cytochrome c [Sphingomicrobium sp.]|nr:cytochrome c [Sphingomicrobium sp.]